MNRKCDFRFMYLGMGGGMTGCWIYRVEAERTISMVSRYAVEVRLPTLCLYNLENMQWYSCCYGPIGPLLVHHDILRLRCRIGTRGFGDL